MPLTPAQLADLIPQYADLAALNADKRTRRDIELEPLGALLNETGISLTLRALTDDATVGEPIQRFLLHMADTRQRYLRTATKAGVADDLADLVEHLSAADKIDAAQVADLYALGGGRVVPAEVTQPEWDAAQALLSLRAAKAQRIAEAQAAYNAFVASVESAQDEASIPPIEEL